MTAKDTSSASYPEFGRLLNQYLSREDRKPADLARYLDVEPSTVGRWLNDGRRPGDPETVGRICDLLRIPAGAQRQALFAAAGYAYVERPAAEAQAINPDDLAAYLEIVRTKHSVLETRAYRSLKELEGPPIRLPLLGSSDRGGIFIPLRYDLQLARPADERDFDQGPTKRRARATRGLPRDLSRTDVELRDVLAAEQVALIGKAGSGKTTVLRLVAAVLATQDVALARQWLGWGDETLPVPVYLALRDFEHACQKQPGRYGRTVESLLRFLDDHFAQWHPKRVTPGFLGRLVEGGRAWLLIDALDEVPDFDHRIAVRKAIEGLASEFPRNRLLVTARVAAYTQANTRLDDRFAVATVRDLTPAQWTPLIERLYAGLEADPDVAAQRAADLTARIARSEQLQEMVKTPLMVWTATLIDSTKRKLPEQRAELYHAYTEVLLGERLKEEESGEAAKMLREEQWPLDDRRLYLTYAAFKAHQAGAPAPGGRPASRAVVVVDEHELTSAILAPFLANYLHIEKAKAKQEAEKFVKVMAERSGILHAQPGGYSFGDHLTVQEFLAACYLVDNLRSEEKQQYHDHIREWVGQSWWQEVFLLAAGYLLRHPSQAKQFLERDLGAIPGDGDAHAYGLAWAGRALLEIPPERVGWHAAVRDELARRLVQALWRNPPTTSVAARFEAGHVLGRLGDPRFTGPYSLPEFIPIPGGRFWMGSDQAEVDRLVKETGQDWYKRELPRHQVELSPFAIARYPTTNAMFQRFIAADGYQDERWWAEAKKAGVWRPDGTVKDRWGDERSRPLYWDDERFNGANQPVVGVTWYEAVAYCRWLTAALDDGYEYRLPTEAEWERAARGPLPSPSEEEGPGVRVQRYPWGDEWIEGRANSQELGLERTTPVGIFPDGASGEGVLDLSGNVWEWCNDWYDEKTYAERARRVERDPQGPPRGNAKVLRGGSWYSNRTSVRCAYRAWNYPDNRNDNDGFRVARGPLI